jgi:hypothetical protein
MPFDEEEDTRVENKKGLKKVSSQNSIFDSAPKKPTQSEFEGEVRSVEKQISLYKNKAAEYSALFKKRMCDTNLNPTIFDKDIENELLNSMINLSSEMNNDAHEQEGIGSLLWIILMLKTFFMQRDKITKLTYELSQCKQKLEEAEFNKAVFSKSNCEQLRAIIADEIQKTFNDSK